MTWENYASHWTIDHIKPIAAFDVNDELEVKKINHYTNLQPLLVKENLAKSSKFNGLTYR